MTDISSLISQAVAAKNKAYAPYSNHPVGAAVRTLDGSIFSGCNVENAAYPLGSCAEAGAIGQMIVGRENLATSSAPIIDQVVIVGPSTAPCPPCGGCRQRLREFMGADMTITLCSNTGEILASYSLSDLLPHSFGPDNLAPANSTSNSTSS